jgi:hypothetical protein
VEALLLLRECPMPARSEQEELNRGLLLALNRSLPKFVKAIMLQAWSSSDLPIKNPSERLPKK